MPPSERFIRQTLKTLSEQRVAMILQPENILVVEQSIGRDEETAAALKTCHLRGWVEVAHDAMPHADLGPNLQIPPAWDGVAPVYRLTEAGWHVLNRTHDWTVGTFWVVTVTLLVSIAILYLTWSAG